MFIFLLIDIALSENFKLIRRSADDINETESVLLQPVPESLVFKYNNSFAYNETQEFFYTKDVYYNIILTIDNNSDYQMYIDLNSPWSWYKTPECKYTNLTLQDISEHPDKLNQSCQTLEFNKSHIIQGDKEAFTKITSQFYQIAGLRRNTNISLGNTTVSLQLLQVHSIISQQLILADGCLSLGVFNNTFNHSIVQALQQKNQENYVMLSQNISDISFLKESQINNIKEITWVESKKQSYQWCFTIHNFSTFNSAQKDEYKAILTINTQYIQLPFQLIQDVSESIMQQSSLTKCDFIDSKHYVLRCGNLTQHQLDTFNLTFYFGNTKVTIQSLIKKCTNTSQLSDCIFKIKLSQSDYIILGDPFFQDNQLLLDFGKSSVGLIEKKKIATPEPKNSLEFTSMQLWIAGLTLLFVLLFCLLNIKYVFKWAIRAIKYRKVNNNIFEAVNTEDEQELRGKEVEFGEMEKAEQMTQSIEENSI